MKYWSAIYLSKWTQAWRAILWDMENILYLMTIHSGCLHKELTREQQASVVSHKFSNLSAKRIIFYEIKARSAFPKQQQKQHILSHGWSYFPHPHLPQGAMQSHHLYATTLHTAKWLCPRRSRRRLYYCAAIKIQSNTTEMVCWPQEHVTLS